MPPSKELVKTTFKADHEGKSVTEEYEEAGLSNGTLTPYTPGYGPIGTGLLAIVTKPDGFARGIVKAPHTGWKAGQEVWWGGAVLLMPGFFEARQGQIDIFRWDNFEQDPTTTERGGIVLQSTDKKFRLVRIKEPSEQKTLNFGEGESLLGPELAENTWYWIMIRQILWPVSGEALNVLYINDLKVSENTLPNCVREDLVVSRYRAGIAATNGKQTNSVSLAVDRVRSGPEQIFAAPSKSRVAVTRDYPPDKIALRIGPRGAGARWAEDEPNPENVLADAEWGTEIPGGYKDFSCTLGRNPQLDWRDLVAYHDAYAYQPGVAKVWEGFLDKAPDVSGEHKSISPSLLGYQSVLEDNNAVQVGFIDCDLSKWGDPSSQLKLNVLGGNSQYQGDTSTGFADAGASGPGIMHHFSRIVTTAGGGPFAIIESWYYGDGAAIGKFLYNFNFAKGGGSNELWDNLTQLSTDDLATSVDSSADYNGLSANAQTLNATTNSRKYVRLYTLYRGTFTGDGEWLVIFEYPKVIGNHGLPIRGTWPNVGLSAKQMLEYLIPTFASPLTVDSEYIDDDGFTIPQAWYGDPTSVADIVRDVVKYGLYDWFVYGDKRFQLRKPGTYGKFWKAYVSPSNLNEVGIDSQRLWRSVVVSYTDVDGNTRTVGPPGSQASVTSSELEIIDPEHPAVKAGRNRVAILDLQGIGTPATAIAVGKRFLEEANLLNRSGSATLAGYVMDQYGIFWPAACVKSGDWISFVDAADKSYRKIINTSYRHSERSNEIDLDAPASGLEALLERLQVGLISLGVN